MRSLEKQTTNEMVALLHDQPSVVSHDLIRNIQTFVRRASHEGFTFMSKILPLLGKALDRALSGKVAFSLPTVFKRYKKTCIPHFLGSALRVIFDDEGNLLDNPCYCTVQWLRTFCFYAYKVEVPFSEKQIQEYSERFIQVDNEIGNIPIVGDTSTSALRSLMRSQLSGLRPDGLRPAFGPGISSNCAREMKYLVYTPPSALRTLFGRSFFLRPEEHEAVEFSRIFWYSYLLSFLGIEPFSGRTEMFSPSKVLFVPKDSRGPRVICCEDSRLMWAQKALQKSLYKQVERGRFSGYVNFTDQTVNQKLTYDKSNATLDMKDASDRVSLNLVIDIFPPNLLRYMLACRSKVATLPTGDSVVLEKFAPMGSALCFPVMALVIYTCVTSAIYLAGGVLPNRNQSVYVYGDDIIVPNEYAEVAMSALESLGLAVNRDKSFVNSRFLESCGADTLDQSDVTPLRKKRLIAKPVKANYRKRRVLVDVEGLVSNLSLANRARSYRYNNLADTLYEEVESLIGKLPYGNSESPYLCRWAADSDIHHWNAALGYESGKLRAFTVRDKSILMDHTPYSRLRRFLVEFGGSEPLNLDEIGARSVYLQRMTFHSHGLSYAGTSPAARQTIEVPR